MASHGDIPLIKNEVSLFDQNNVIITCVLGFKAIGRVFDFIELFNRP